jgi:hypothetical protein
MKQLLFFILFVIAFIRVEAQHDIKKSRFAFVSIPFNAGDGVYEIRIDSGQAPITRRASIMRDSAGKSLQFVSPAAALHYVESIGWKLQEVLHDTESQSYLFKKDY